MFIKYPKIHRLGKSETEGILKGTVTVQEKLDGANTSIWLENGSIKCGSRNRELINDNFNGFVEYVKNHQGIIDYLNRFPDHRLYGEWLVKHTVNYNKTAYKQFYLFDIMNKNENFFDQDVVQALAKTYNINTPQIFGVFENPTKEKLQEFVGQSNLGDNGEGVVLKNLDFINRFGNFCYAKIVTQEFKESNAFTFGGNNKSSETYWEMYVVNKYCTLGRVKKIINKLQPEINEQLDFKHTSRIVGTCYHDMITEEIWEIQKKVPKINFRQLQNLAKKKFAVMYKELITNVK